ncbi:hypothetical protein B0H13DRAFT_2542223 [Mycena leptocephala]|nr:hypothetical protein B0H13DRAFT_2542223 [Mycena leptocephala]
MRLRASLLVNLTTALLARAQADNAVSANSLSSVPRPTDPALSELELDVDDDGDRGPGSFAHPASCVLRLPANTLLALGRSGAPRRLRLGLPDVHLAYGPMLICVFFNMILYGVFVGQALTYYQLYRRDGAWMQFFTRTPHVFYLFVVETLNMGFDMAMMDQLFVLQYDYFPHGASRSPFRTCCFADPRARSIPYRYASASDSERILILNPASFHRSSQSPCSRCVRTQVLVSTPIQIQAFFAWRIWTTMRRAHRAHCFTLVAFAMETKGGEGAIPSSKGGAMAGSTGSRSVAWGGAGIRGHGARGGDDEERGRGGAEEDITETGTGSFMLRLFVLARYPSLRRPSFSLL